MKIRASFLLVTTLLLVSVLLPSSKSVTNNPVTGKPWILEAENCNSGLWIAVNKMDNPLKAPIIKSVKKHGSLEIMAENPGIAKVLLICFSPKVKVDVTNVEFKSNPDRQVITSITVKGDGKNPIKIQNSHGDLWFSTWADDGNLYSTWGDGNGFGDIFSDVGVAILKGNLPNLEGENIYHEKHPGLIKLVDNDKPSGLLFLDGRLYGHFYSPLAIPRIGYNAYSDDYGKTWTRVGFFKNVKEKPDDASPWTSEFRSNFKCLHFINMGKNYELNEDGYVYGLGIGKPVAWKNGIYLTRVEKDGILDYGSYEYYIGMDGGNPKWSGSQSDAEMLEGLETPGQFSAIYHPGIDRYLLLTSKDLFEAPQPWGPWVLAGRWNENLPTEWEGGYQPGIITKNLGEDYFWFTISGGKDSELGYLLNLGKIKWN